MKYGDVLKELLEDRGITQKQLAKELCLASSTIGNYVNNQREPDYSVLKQIAAYFHVSTDYLLCYSSEPEVYNHVDERLLQLFHSMSDEAKEFFLDEAVSLVKHFPA